MPVPELHTDAFCLPPGQSARRGGRVCAQEPWREDNHGFRMERLSQLREQAPVRGRSPRQSDAAGTGSAEPSAHTSSSKEVTLPALRQPRGLNIPRGRHCNRFPDMTKPLLGAMSTALDTQDSLSPSTYSLGSCSAALPLDCCTERCSIPHSTFFSLYGKEKG